MQKYNIGLVKTIILNKSIVVEAETEYEAVEIATKQIDFSIDATEGVDYEIRYIKEIDNIFDVLYQQYYHNLEADIFFPKDDSPCIIPLPASGQQRIDIISEYLTPSGELYGDEESIFNPNKLTELEALIQQQKTALEMEQRERAMYEKFKI